MTLSPLERADALREAYTASPEVDAYGRIWMPEGEETVTDPTMDELLPAGAVILTPEETEQVRETLLVYAYSDPPHDPAYARRSLALLGVPGRETPR